MAKAALKLIDANEEPTPIVEDHSEGELEVSKIVKPDIEAGRINKPKRRTRIHDLLSLIDDLQTNSLDDVLQKAIEEGERFKKWKDSGLPLGNIEIYHKKNNELRNISHYEKLSAFRSTEITVKLDASPDSQFEIWRCDERRKRDFPLYRLRLAEVEENKKLNISEPLRDDVSLNIKPEVINDSVFITFSICTGLQTQEVCEQSGAKKNIKPRNLFSALPGIILYTAGKIKSMVEVAPDRRKRGMRDFGNGFATAMLLFMLFYIAPIFLSVSPENSKAAETSQSVHTVIRDTSELEDKRLNDRCNKERCRG